MRPLIIGTLIVVLAATCVSAQVATTGDKVFIAIADVETGRALIPDGTVVPAGVRFYVHKNNPADVENQDESGDTPAGQQLVFAYAPDADFVQARRAIAAHRGTMERERPAFFASPEAPAHRGSRDFDMTTLDTPTSYYLYFADGSYLSARRHRYDNGGNTWWGVSTTVYSEPGGYYTGTLTPKQTSNLVWGPVGGPYFDPYGKSKTCTIDYNGGTCQTDQPYVQTQTALVDSKGTIMQRYGSCILYPNEPPPEQPCKIIYSGTIRTTVPW